MDIKKSDKNIKTLLIIDDDPRVCRSLAGLLKECDYSVIVSKSAQEALIQVQEEAIDVVLTDIRMPHDSGTTLLNKIHDIDPDLPVILMTAYTDVDTAIAAIVNGAFDFITKPFNADYLLNRLSRAVTYSALLKLRKNYSLMLEKTVAEKTRELEEALSTLDIMSREI